ncbi:MAG: ATP-dependent zinc metalloprotease FtsH [Planctomycetota bacterium]|jgi:cell division protease FtsH|nr:ATP-dependent zinc metalloprotease FtsH [Planctomycetota bacterium]MEC8303790.1 ATP-dependent zinc metalloprotease FtsH [Planctomycetota bacterium]MEE3074722.1 ATP-dependent zinc metalloprotease FtsH [Planctomycetota bacterium]
MDEQRRTGDGNADENRPGFRGMNIWIAITALVLVLAALLMIWTPKSSQVKLSFVIQQIEGVDESGLPIEKDGEPIGCNVESLKFQGNKVSGVFKDPPLEPDFEKVGATSGRERKKLEKEFYAITGPADSPDYQRVVKAAEQQNVPREYAQETNPSAWLTIILFAFMIGAVFFVWGQIRRQQSQMLNGGGFLSGFNRSPAKKYEGADQQITFKDVAGLEGVKADLQEIVEYLKEPEKFRKLGGRVPKGVLLNGPPGTGKTLLARAVAGEADVPYYSVSGSEFIQMFVGVGASRVRDLFGTAKENSPAIIFVDEIDAVGRQRGAGLGGGHDEREQTLNQILSEMDGFSGADSVIVLAATNRPDVLDPALLRPGRFDRHVTVSRPTQKGRVAIFKVHVRDVPLASDVDLDVLASGCIGLTGADIRNMVNEAALWAARKNKTKVEMCDFEHARDKILMGAKREEVLSDKEKEKTAYHEVGHTLAAWFLEGSHPVHKVTIIPRGQALGVTQMMPSEDKLNMSESELRDELVVLLSGRAAEKLIYDEVSVGAENDLERATNLARRMVMNWGMSAKIGPVSYKVTGDDPFLGREINQQRQFSEHTMETIDEEVVSILSQASQRATQLLEEKREELRELTQALINSEELDRFAIEKVIGPSVHKPMAIEENSETAEAESEQSTTDENVASDVSPENQLADAGAEASDSADHAGQSS